MEIKHTDNGKTGRFYIEIDGKEEAKLTYKHSGDRQITIEHTIVNEALKGRGIGRQLVDAAVLYLRQNGLKAVLECSYAKSVFDRNAKELDALRA